MSLGGPYSHAVNNFTSKIVNLGIPIVVAAGNEQNDSCNSGLASAPGVITVAGSARGDHVYSYTNGGSCVDVFAPGSSVIGADYSCSECNCTTTRSGTSMATPLVSGVIALYLQERPLNLSQILEKLTNNCLKDALDYKHLHHSLNSTTTNCLLHYKSKFL